MKQSDDLRNSREISRSEVLDKTAKVLSSFVPGGSAAYELITTIVVPLHEKRKREFIEDLANRIYKLEQKGKVNIQQLSESEEFNTVITKALLLAQQNHEIEKIEYLKLLVLKSGILINKKELNYDTVQVYLKIVDQISGSQFKILKLLKNPEKALMQVDTKALKKFIFIPQIFMAAYPEITKSHHSIELLWKDLFKIGLINTEDYHSKVSFNVEQISASNIKNASLIKAEGFNILTSLGKDFLNFVDRDIYT